MAEVFLPNANGVKINAYGSSSYKPTTYCYYIRFSITETSISTTESTYTLKFQCKNDRSGDFWASTAESLQPKLYIYIDRGDGNGPQKIEFKSPGSSTASTTGYFRTAAKAYTGSTTWQTITTVTGLTVPNTFLHPAQATFGVGISQGTGAYSGPLGPGWCTDPEGGTSGTVTTYSSTYNQVMDFFFHTMCEGNTTNGVFTRKKSPLSLKIDGNWVEGTPYVKVDGNWYKGRTWVKISGTWVTLESDW